MDVRATELPTTDRGRKGSTKMKTKGETMTRGTENEQQNCENKKLSE